MDVVGAGVDHGEAVPGAELHVADDDAVYADAPHVGVLDDGGVDHGRVVEIRVGAAEK